MAGVSFALFGDTTAEPLGIRLLMPVAAAAIFLGFVTVRLGDHVQESPGEVQILEVADAAGGA